MDIYDIRKKIIEKCANDTIFYIENFCHIEDKTKEEIIQPFKMWEAQKQAVLSMESHSKNVVLKARQLGISWLVIAYASKVLLTRSGRLVIGLSRSETEAAELARRLGFQFQHMPTLIAEAGREPVNWKGPVYKQLTMEIHVYFPDEPESRFVAFPSNPNAARSFTADLLIFDEWAFQQFAEEIWASAFPVINRPGSGQVIGVSTNNKGSLFEKIFTDANNGFNKIFIPWYADPSRDNEWYQKTKDTLGDAVLQEYPATIEEALRMPGGVFFPEVTSEGHITKKPLNTDENGKEISNVVRYVCIDYGLDMLSAHWIMIDDKGNAQVYREYDKSNMTIGEASDAILSLSSGEKIEAYLAPPDLWSRDQVTGKSRALIFNSYGLNLTKVSNDIADGCANMKEWLKVQGNGKALLTILENCAPNLFNCLTQILKDKNKPNIYAKIPHELTHDVDSLRYFCVWWTVTGVRADTRKRKKWSDDLIADYMNANESGKEVMRKLYGEPQL